MRLSRSKSISWFSRWTLTPTLMREDPLAVRHSLVRLLAVVDRNSLDAHRALELFSQEHWGLHRWGLQGLLQSLKREKTLVQALEKNPSRLGDAAMLTLRLGDATGTRQAAWEELTDWHRPIHSDATKLWRSSKGYWATVALVLMLISLFFLFVLVPSFRRLVRDFELEFDGFEASLPMLEIGTLISGVLVGLPLLVLLWIAWCVATWHPKSWLRRFSVRGRWERAMLQTGLGRLLAMNLALGVSAKKSIELLASLHESAPMRKRLSLVNDSISNGTDTWQSLVHAKLLHPIERDAIAATENPEVQAWTLRHLALRRRENLHFGALRRTMWVQPLVTLFFGLFVLAIATFVFSTLTQLVLLLAERHG